MEFVSHKEIKITWDNFFSNFILIPAFKYVKIKNPLYYLCIFFPDKLYSQLKRNKKLQSSLAGAWLRASLPNKLRSSNLWHCFSMLHLQLITSSHQ